MELLRESVVLCFCTCPKDLISYSEDTCWPTNVRIWKPKYLSTNTESLGHVYNGHHVPLYSKKRKAEEKQKPSNQEVCCERVSSRNEIINKTTTIVISTNNLTQKEGKYVLRCKPLSRVEKLASPQDEPLH